MESDYTFNWIKSKWIQITDKLRRKINKNCVEATCFVVFIYRQRQWRGKQPIQWRLTSVQALGAQNWMLGNVVGSSKTADMTQLRPGSPPPLWCCSLPALSSPRLFLLFSWARTSHGTQALGRGTTTVRLLLIFKFNKSILAVPLLNRFFVSSLTSR